jgi:hypothetical protein
MIIFELLFSPLVIRLTEGIHELSLLQLPVNFDVLLLIRHDEISLKKALFVIKPYIHELKSVVLAKCNNDLVHLPERTELSLNVVNDSMCL